MSAITAVVSLLADLPPAIALLHRHPVLGTALLLLTTIVIGVRPAEQSRARRTRRFLRMRLEVDMGSQHGDDDGPREPSR